MLTKNWYAYIGGFATNSFQLMKDFANRSRYACYTTVNSANVGFSLWNIMSNPLGFTVGDSVTTGVTFGSGNTIPTLDDYKMENQLTGLSASVSRSYGTDENGCYCTAVYTITNAKSEPVTISEIGLWGKVYSGNSVGNTNGSPTQYGPFLWDRTVLESPITIPAGGVGQVTYTIRMNYPTA